MLGYVTIGANDLDRACSFYDAAMGALGFKRKFKDGGWAGYGPEHGDADFMLCAPFNGQPATWGNGVMVALKAPSRAAVDAFHERGLGAGGKDEGAPGVRGEGDPPWYGAYLRDPEGNKICAYYKG